MIGKLTGESRAVKYPDRRIYNRLSLTVAVTLPGWREPVLNKLRWENGKKKAESGSGRRSSEGRTGRDALYGLTLGCQPSRLMSGNWSRSTGRSPDSATGRQCIRPLQSLCAPVGAIGIRGISSRPNIWRFAYWVTGLERELMLEMVGRGMKLAVRQPADPEHYYFR